MSMKEFWFSIAAGVIVFGLVKVYEYYFEGGKEAKDARRAQGSSMTVEPTT